MEQTATDLIDRLLDCFDQRYPKKIVPSIAQEGGAENLALDEKRVWADLKRMLSALYAAPTVAEMALAVTQEHLRMASPIEIEELLAQVAAASAGG
jgi:hypothetical protein